MADCYVLVNCGHREEMLGRLRDIITVLWHIAKHSKCGYVRAQVRLLVRELESIVDLLESRPEKYRRC